MARRREAGETGEREGAVFRFNTKLNINIAELLTFSRETNKVLGFLTVYKLYIRIRMKNASVEEQI